MITSQKKKLAVLSDYLKKPVTIGHNNEFPTLKIGDKVITEGSEEVSARIDVLIKEYGLQYDLDN
jgi:hypothetical protein